MNLSLSQTLNSILTKASGQLIQDLCEKDEWKAIGKAIETVGEMSYETEKIRLQNRRELTIITNPNNTTSVHPIEGFKWRNPEVKNDYSVEPLVSADTERYELAIQLVVWANDYIQLDEYSTAIMYLDRSISEEKTALGYYARGLCYYELNIYDKALEDFENTLRFNNDNDLNGEIYKMRSAIFLQQKKYRESLNSLNIYKNSYYRFDDSLPFVYSAMAYNKSELNDFTGAISDYTTAIRLFDNKRRLTTSERESLGFFNLEMGIVRALRLDDYQNALNDINASINWDGEVGRAYFVRGIIKYKLGFYDNMCSDFDIANELGFSTVSMAEVYNKHCE